jgi:hypothetical protein
VTNNIYKILGTIFLIISAVIYTSERVIEKISVSLVNAGFASHGSSVNNEPNYPGFFGNFFVWFFFFLGFLLLAYGFPNNKK